MFATIRRYESVDVGRTSELVKKVDEGLAPRLSKLPGFRGYYLVDVGDGVLTSIGLFDTPEHADGDYRRLRGIQPTDAPEDNEGAAGGADRQRVGLDDLVVVRSRAVADVADRPAPGFLA